MSTLLLMFALLAADTYKTEVIFLGDLPAERALALHERLIGQSGESTAVLGKSPNVIVVKDTPERLKRFHALLKALDVKGAAELRVFIRPVQHVLPSDLVTLASEVIAEGALAKVRMVPDDHSRQLIVMTTAKTYRALDKLLRRLDAAPEGDHQRGIRVTPAPTDSKPGEFPP